jgi:hypothetical protein
VDPAGVERALRVGADDLDLCVPFLEVAARSSDRAAGPDAEHEMCDLSVGLLPDLGPGRVVVSLGIHRVVVLIRQEAAGRLLREPLGHLVIGLRRLGWHRGRAHHDLGAEGAQQIALLLTLLVGHRADDAVALDRRRHRETHAGVAARRLDDGAAGLQQTAPLRVLDHPQADAVLDRAAGVEMLELASERRLQASPDTRESDQRRVPNDREDVRGEIHFA